MANDENKPSDDEILELAMVLQDEAAAKQEAVEDREDRIRAANELGVSRKHLIAAENQLYKQREQRSHEQQQMKRMWVKGG